MVVANARTILQVLHQEVAVLILTENLQEEDLQLHAQLKKKAAFLASWVLVKNLMIEDQSEREILIVLQEHQEKILEEVTIKKVASVLAAGSKNQLMADLKIDQDLEKRATILSEIAKDQLVQEKENLLMIEESVHPATDAKALLVAKEEKVRLLEIALAQEKENLSTLSTIEENAQLLAKVQVTE